MEDADLDTALDVLANTERRRLLRELQSSDTYAVATTDTRAATALIHNHLPKLAENQYVEYEHTATEVTVRRGRNWDEISGLLDKVTAPPSPDPTR